MVVLQCFLRRSLLWLWLAIGYHALVDFAAVMLARYSGPLAAEAAVAVFAAFSLYLIFKFRELGDSAQGASG